MAAAPLAHSACTTVVLETIPQGQKIGRWYRRGGRAVPGPRSGSIGSIEPSEGKQSATNLLDEYAGLTGPCT